jgi:hypothetical protein
MPHGLIAKSKYRDPSTDGGFMAASSLAVLDSNGRSSTTMRVRLLAVCALLAPWFVGWSLPPFAQPQSFHDYADQRVWLGLPHAADVLSNLPFLAVGALGLHFVLHGWRTGNPAAFFQQHTAWPYALLFAGIVLTAFGSAWYHAQPSDASLVWDRLPMALGFAGLVAGTLTDRAPQRILPWMLTFAAVGAGTVLYWHASGNLVPYLAMQVTFITAALVATAWIKPLYTHSKRVYAATGLYLIAVIFERLDHQIYGLLGGWISGHTLKHLFACAAIAVVLSMLRARRLAMH